MLQRKYPGEWDVPPNTAVPAPPSDSKEQWDQLLDCVALQVRQETAATPPHTERASAEKRTSSASASASATASTSNSSCIGSGSGSGSLAGDVHASLVSVSRAQYERELSALQAEQSQLQATLARALDGGACDARIRAAVVERTQQLQHSTYNRLRDVMRANLSLHEVCAHPDPYCRR